MTSSRYHNIYLDGAACFWTSSVVDRIAVLRSPTVARELLKIWDECRGRCNVRIIGYVIMPDHIHLAVWSEHAANVQRFLRQSLSLASARIVAMTERAAMRGNRKAELWLEQFRARARRGTTAKVWKERGRGFPATDPDVLRQKLQYMHNNPVNARLVERPEDWEFSSASWYVDGSGPFHIDEFGW